MDMTKKTHRIRIKEVALILLIFLFAYSSAIKLNDLDAFADKLLKSPLIGIKYLVPLVYLVPIGELLIAITLVYPKSRTIGKYLSCFALTLFSLYLIALNNLDDFVPCSCGGLFEKLTFNQHIILNLILWGLSVILVFTDKRKMYLKPQF